MPRKQTQKRARKGRTVQRQRSSSSSSSSAAAASSSSSSSSSTVLFASPSGDDLPAGGPALKKQMTERLVLSSQRKKELVELFEIFDQDGSGKIERKELRMAMQAHGLSTSEEELAALMGRADRNGDGGIDLDEFIHMMTAKLSKRDPRQEMEKGWDLFAKGDEFITLESLRRVAEDLGETEITDAELQRMIATVDANGDGKVTRDEFFSIISPEFFP